MRIAPTLSLFFAVIFNYIDSSSQFDCLPNGEPMPCVPRSRTSDSESQDFSERSDLSVKCDSLDSLIGSSPAQPLLCDKSGSPSLIPNFPVRSSAPAESAFLVRRKSPPVIRSYFYILGFKPDELRFIRLIPKTNPNRKFEIRKYSFPSNVPLRLKGQYRSLGPMPTGEQTVLSTPDGDIFAIIVESTKTLRGMYTTRTGVQRRVKINMNSGNVVEMNSEEVKDTPLGSRNQILKNFRILNVT